MPKRKQRRRCNNRTSGFLSKQFEEVKRAANRAQLYVLESDQKYVFYCRTSGLALSQCHHRNGNWRRAIASAINRRSAVLVGESTRTVNYLETARRESV